MTQTNCATWPAHPPALELATVSASFNYQIAYAQQQAIMQRQYVFFTFLFIKTLSVTSILRAALAKFIVYVYMYVYMCNYSSQTTEPICIKIIQANRASYADCYRLLRFEIFTPTIFKTPKKPQKGVNRHFQAKLA